MFVSTSDPTAADDSGRGFFVGAQWINTSNGRRWVAVSVTGAAAVWAYAGVAASLGAAPASNPAQMGASSASMLASGLLSKQVWHGGTSPNATGADRVLAAYTLPANLFDVVGQSIEVEAFGSFANNGNTKECKLIFNPSSANVGSTVGSGGDTIAGTGASVGAGVGWNLRAVVAKSGTNTQIAQGQSIVGTTHRGTTQLVTSSATDSGDILVCVTGNPTTTDTDIFLNLFTITGRN